MDTSGSAFDGFRSFNGITVVDHYFQLWDRIDMMDQYVCLLDVIALVNTNVACGE